MAGMPQPPLFPASGMNEDFYARLPPLERFEEVIDPARYAPLPESWALVITDVRGSTRAIEAGRYRDVNALGAASIIGVKNALDGLEIPFVFGGDGATLAVPGSRLLATQVALRGMRQLAQNAFSMELRTSVVPIAELVASGHLPKVARYRSGPHTVLTMFAGNAFSVAEAWVKHPTRGLEYEVAPEGECHVDLEGFECRWRPIRSKRGTIACLLVTALGPTEVVRQGAYGRVLEALQSVVDADRARPVTAGALQFAGLGGDYSIEARMRAQAAEGPLFDQYVKSARKQTVVGSVLSGLGIRAFRFDGAKYKREVELNTDFRKFDDTLRMVLDLSLDELTRMRELLEAERATGEIAFGIHTSSEALMTCFVRSYDGNHLHFVDGSDGGYALAAKQLKAQLNESQ